MDVEVVEFVFVVSAVDFLHPRRDKGKVLTFQFFNLNNLFTLHSNPNSAF